MPDPGKTFSESWYRVAGQRVALRPQAQVRRQFFRGEKWYVVGNPFTNEYFRLRPEAYAFVARLRPDRTIEEVWTACLERDADASPGQEDVIRLLAQLYHANLLQYDAPADSLALFDRYEKRRKKEIQSRVLGIMFARIPLLDPDRFLTRLLPVVRPLFSPFGAILWLAVVFSALKVAVENVDRLVNQSEGILAPDNLVLLYAGLILVKVLHEFGHAFACRHFGGEVHTMGVMLLVFTPIPFVDATSSWAFRSRWQRALVGAGGMIVELFVAALATFVWANTGGGVLHSLAYNMMFVASVSTVLFNANPLLRFDGYYILSDLLDIPNLHTRSAGQLRHVVERYLFGYEKSEGQAESRKEAAQLVGFGILSGIYRVVVFTGIIFFVADRFLLAGLVMALVCVVSWGIVPLGRFVHYLASSPRLERTRLRAVGCTLALAGFVIALLQFVSFPHSFASPGVVKAVRHAEVAADAPGVLVEILARPGVAVRSGQTLVRLADPELDYRIAQAEASRQHAEARLRKARSDSTADLQPMATYLQVAESRVEHLLELQRSLVIAAPMDGVWSAPGLEGALGARIPRGTGIGQVVDTSGFEFSAVVSQQESDRIFSSSMEEASVRLRGRAGIDIPVLDYYVIPADQQELPSAALGWQAGGDLAVALDQAGGTQAAEPFFRLQARIDRADGVEIRHGRSGRIRFRLPSEPLLPRWVRSFRQMLQDRYQL